MFFEKIRRLPHTLAFRLSLWYAGIFTLSSLAAFVVFYFLVASLVQRHIDEEVSKEISEFSSLLAAKGVDAVKANVHFEAESSGVEKMFFRILSPDGDVLASSAMSSWSNVGARRAALKRLAGGEDRVFETLTVPGQEHSIRVGYGVIGPGMIMQIGHSLGEIEDFMGIVRRIFGTSLALLMIVAAVVGWFMARRALEGVEEVTQTAIEISKGALDLRVPVKERGDEIDRLATTFNGMLDRIHALITEMREMTDNIAHDLRSPITGIRGIAEMALTSRGSLHEYEAMAADTIEECDRLLEMINTMLDITEVEAGAGRLRMEEVDISTLVLEACELFQPMAEDKGITLVSSARADHSVRGDVRRLQRMVANLLDNALKYTPSRGMVTASVHEKDDMVVISVTDTGIGISENDLPHIFTRFFRCDQSRTQAGTGLGLSLARAIAEAHGGSVAVSSSPGKGSAFTVTLPGRPHRR
jgi:heavy metal sensor kinase